MIKSSAHRAPEAVHGTRRVAMRGRNKREASCSHVSRETQRGVSAVEVASQARSMLLLVSDKGEIELGESRSSRQGPAHAPRPA